MIQTREQAQHAIASGAIGEAMAWWRSTAAARESPADLLEFLQVLWNLYQFAEAVPVQEKLLAHPDTTAGQCLTAAKELFGRNRIRECVQFTERAVRMDGSNPDTLVIHAGSLERSGHPEEARELLIRTLQQHPHHLRSVRLLAHLERIQGRTEEAIALLRHQLATGQTEEDWRLRYELAPALEKAGDYKGAMEALAAAKAQLAPQARPHRQPWREITARQWDLTASLDAGRLREWDEGAHSLTPPLRLCLLAGFPRSGTTLLENILTAHPDCLGTDESGILATQFRDPLVLMPADTRSVLHELDNFDAESISAGRAEYLRCTGEYLDEVPAGRMLLEKEPLLTADLPVPLRLFPDAKIVMPLRDPRDVVISFYFTIVPLGSSSVAAIDLGESCRYYAEVMRHWLYLREIIPRDRWLESRYEDLLADPEGQTRKLSEFLGIAWSPAMLAHHRNAERKAVSTPTYADVAQPLYTRSLGRWRHYGEWLQPHMHHLEPYLHAFGYS